MPPPMIGSIRALLPSIHSSDARRIAKQREKHFLSMMIWTMCTWAGKVHAGDDDDGHWAIGWRTEMELLGRVRLSRQIVGQRSKFKSHVRHIIVIIIIIFPKEEKTHLTDFLLLRLWYTTKRIENSFFCFSFFHFCYRLKKVQTTKW